MEPERTPQVRFYIFGITIGSMDRISDQPSVYSTLNRVTNLELEGRELLPLLPHPVYCWTETGFLISKKYHLHKIK
jgi:hypothetical protein